MVVNEGSMTAAADKLFLTQPAISQQIRNLEEELGVEILVRGVRQVKLTLQGEMLYDYAKRILQLTQQAEVAVKTMGKELRGKLRIGSLNSVGVQLISPVVGRLLKYNPHLNIKIDYARGDELVNAFDDERLDALILPDLESHFKKNLSGIEKKFLFKEEMWLVGSSKDTGIPKQIDLKEFTQHPVISLEGEYPDFDQKLKTAVEAAKISYSPIFEATNVGTLKRVVESGLGWGFLPSLCIRKQVKMGRLTHVDVRGFRYETDFFFYTRKGNQLGSLTEVFYHALLQQEKT